MFQYILSLPPVVTTFCRHALILSYPSFIHNSCPALITNSHAQLSCASRCFRWKSWNKFCAGAIVSLYRKALGERRNVVVWRCIFLWYIAHTLEVPADTLSIV